MYFVNVYFFTSQFDAQLNFSLSLSNVLACSSASVCGKSDKSRGP